MTASPHRLILASAGTGKTWQLTGRFLALLLDGVPPERVLATTFTRKAAGEILQRVLERLVEAAEDPVELGKLADQVGRELGADEARTVLARLTRSLHRMQVRTLDAFFVHLAKLFALDLGLPADWTIVEDSDDAALRREAIARALERAHPLEIVEILRDLRGDEASRSVEWALLGAVDEGRDAYLDSRPEAWRRIVAPPGLDEEQLAAALAAVEAMPLPRKADGEPRKHWAGARDAILEAVARGDWNALRGVTLVQRAQEPDGASFDTKPIEEAHRAALRPLLDHMAHVLVAEVARANEATHRWLERFERSYEAAKSEERAYRFEDLPKALHPRDDSRLPEREAIWYRLDARVDHLLLDEFQDTAPVQWRILAHLAEEILADGTGERSFFCVGDVKQSIYGWREAEPRLLAEMDAAYPVLAPEPLARSYRSSPVVLDTVRRVFGTLADNPAFGSYEERGKAGTDWQARFDEPLAARPELPGAAVLLQSREPAEGEPKHLPPLELAARRARELAEEAPGASIAILLRRNTHLARTIHLLRKEGLHPSGEGGNPLVDSAAVLHLVSLLHLADHPGDEAAAFHVACSPLGERFGLDRDAFRARREDPAGERERRRRAAAEVRRRLADEGYGAFAASLRDLVAAGYGAWDRRRYDQLVDLAHAFDDRADQRADRFVDHVRATSVEDPTATRVQAMTIHAAKGLEFDAVLLPELDLPFSLRRSALLTRRERPAGLLDAVSRSRSREVCALSPELLGLWQEHERRETTEALCLLYVAMTRAKHRLELVTKARKTAAPPCTTAGVVRGALGDGPPDGRGVLWEHPDNAERWFPAAEPAAAAPAPPRGPEREPALVPDGPLFRAERAPRVLPRRTPSAQEGEGVVEAATLLRSPRAPARVRGELLHRWLAEVEWLDAFDADDDALRAVGREVTDEADALADALAAFRAALARPGLAAVLARPPGEAEVWRERAFAVVLPHADGDGADGRDELWSGAFDRVVLHREDGRLVRAELVDFKTDRVDAGGLDERVRLYRPQLAGYRRVLARMTGLDEAAIAARLVFLATDAVVDVGA